MEVKKLDMSQQSVLDIQKFIHVLVCTNRNTASRSALVRPHLKCCVCLEFPVQIVMDLLEQLQTRAAKMITWMQHPCHGERLSDLSFFQAGEEQALGRPYYSSIRKGDG